MSRQLRGTGGTMDPRAFIFQSSLYMFETGGQAGQDLAVRLVCQQLEGGQEDAYLISVCQSFASDGQ